MTSSSLELILLVIAGLAIGALIAFGVKVLLDWWTMRDMTNLKEEREAAFEEQKEVTNYALARLVLMARGYLPKNHPVHRHEGGLNQKQIAELVHHLQVRAKNNEEVQQHLKDLPQLIEKRAARKAEFEEIQMYYQAQSHVPIRKWFVVTE